MTEYILTNSHSRTYLLQILTLTEPLHAILTHSSIIFGYSIKNKILTAAAAAAVVRHVVVVAAVVEALAAAAAAVAHESRLTWKKRESKSQNKHLSISTVAANGIYEYLVICIE